MQVSPALIVLLIAAAASAQKKPCCGPKQYMAGIGATVGTYDPAVGASGLTYYQYGAWDFSKRIFGYYMVTDDHNGTSATFRMIQNFAQGDQWVIVDSVKYCTKQTIAVQEPSACIPATATFAGSGFIGGVKGISQDSWSLNLQRPQDKVDGFASINVAQGTCLPLGSSFVGTAYDRERPLSVVSGNGWINMTLGIPDPDQWFNVPSFCSQSKDGLFSRLRPALPDLSILQNIPFHH